MSLPNYIINLPDLANIITDFITESDDEDKKMKSKGFIIQSQANEVDEILWIPQEDIGITGIRFGQEDIRNMGYEDSFDILINGNKVLDNIHYKELNEYKNFRNPRDVDRGSEIVIINRNNSSIDKEVKFDIDYMAADLPRKEVVLVCIDQNTGEVIRRVSVFHSPYYKGLANPPTVDSYNSLSEPREIVVGQESPEIQFIEFYYESEDILEDDFEIGHGYDWMFVLRWEGEVSTDLDLYAHYNNKVINYNNRRDVVYGSGGEINRGIWLDYDYRSHPEPDDRENKPEIVTVLGRIARDIELSVRVFSGGSQLTEDVTVEVFRKQKSGGIILIDEIAISPSQLEGMGTVVPVLNLDTVSERIALL